MQNKKNIVNPFILRKNPILFPISELFPQKVFLPSEILIVETFSLIIFSDLFSETSDMFSRKTDY